MGDRRPRLAPLPPATRGELIAGGGPEILSAAGMNSYGNSPANATEAYNQYLNFGWQLQLWAYYHSIGPFAYGMNWLANAFSRVSLIIAEVMPGQEQPLPVEEDDAKVAIAILNQLKWDESYLLKHIALQVSIPGRGYLVGREIKGNVGGFEREWNVYSPQQVRPVPANKIRTGGLNYEYELWEWGGVWTPLDTALVTVIRDPDPCYTWLDTSNAQAALTILREIDLYDKDIISTLVSRIANNGLLLVPSEVTFPSREEFNDADDPFMLELIEVAKQAIKDPGSASAAIPLPLKVPSQFIEKFRHLILASGVDKIVLEARQKAFGILADTINLPREILTGMGDVNHSAGLMRDLSASAIDMHISPLAEIVCRCMTVGFLYPQMVANREPLIGPHGGRLVVWYDTSELTSQPDLSDKAVDLYDRLELSGDALRRETGFSEDDAPERDELRDQILKKTVNQAALALTALAELTGSSTSRSQRTQDTGSEDAPTPDDGVPQSTTPQEQGNADAVAAEEV